MEFFLQLAINGLVVGSIYSLVALGFVIIYKSSGILNFAQGEFLLLGAYVFLAIVPGPRAAGAGAAADASLFATLLGPGHSSGCVLRPLIGEPIISVIMVTLGLSSVLRAIVQGIWGTDTRPLPAVFSLRAHPARSVAGRARLPLQRRVGGGAAGPPHPLLQVLAPGHRHARDRRLAAGCAVDGHLACGASSRSPGASPRWSRAAGGSCSAPCAAAWTARSPILGLKVLPVVILGGLDSVGGAHRRRPPHRRSGEPGRRLPRPGLRRRREGGRALRGAGADPHGPALRPFGRVRDRAGLTCSAANSAPPTPADMAIFETRRARGRAGRLPGGRSSRCPSSAPPTGSTSPTASASR